MKLSGKTAIVTGAGRGIGKAIAIALAKEGCNIVACARNEQHLNMLAREVELYGVRCAIVSADLRDLSSINKILAATESFGSIDILINNAGVCPMMPIKDTSYALWNQVMAVNMGGVFLCCREMIRQAVAANKPASIVNIASATAYLGSRNGKTHYAASKGCVISFTSSLAKEVARDHIRVNAFAPAIMYTDMTAELLDRDLAHYEKQIPVGRIATLEEAADAILFLASDASAYMTGSVLDFSGGQLGR